MLLVVFVKEHINTTPGAPPHYSAHTPEMSITPDEIIQALLKEFKNLEHGVIND